MSVYHLRETWQGNECFDDQTFQKTLIFVFWESEENTLETWSTTFLSRHFYLFMVYWLKAQYNDNWPVLNQSAVKFWINFMANSRRFALKMAISV